MAINTFISLAVPHSGVGAASDVSSLSAGPTMVTNGPEDGGAAILEISNDGGTNFAPATLSPIPNPPFKVLTSKINRDTADPQDGHATTTGGLVAQYARIRRQSGGGASSVSLGAPTTTTNLFATLGYAPVSTQNMGPFKTICVCGTYQGVVVVEGSVDGTQYDAVAFFDTGNSDIRCLEGSYVSMRLRAGTAIPSGSVSVGGGFLASEGASSGSPLFSHYYRYNGLDETGSAYTNDSFDMYGTLFFLAQTGPDIRSEGEGSTILNCYPVPVGGTTRLVVWIHIDLNIGVDVADALQFAVYNSDGDLVATCDVVAANDTGTIKIFDGTPLIDIDEGDALNLSLIVSNEAGPGVGNLAFSASVNGF